MNYDTVQEIYSEVSANEQGLPCGLIVSQWLPKCLIELYKLSASFHCGLYLYVMPRDLRIGNFRSNRISTRISGNRLHAQCRLSRGSCVCALATAVQLHVKWSCKHKSQLQTAQRLMSVEQWVSVVCNDGTRHVRPIRKFRIGTSLRIEYESVRPIRIRIEYRSCAGP